MIIVGREKCVVKKYPLIYDCNLLSPIVECLPMETVSRVDFERFRERGAPSLDAFLSITANSSVPADLIDILSNKLQTQDTQGQEYWESIRIGLLNFLELEHLGPTQSEYVYLYCNAVSVGKLFTEIHDIVQAVRENPEYSGILENLKDDFLEMETETLPHLRETAEITYGALFEFRQRHRNGTKGITSLIPNF